MIMSVDVHVHVVSSASLMTDIVLVVLHTQTLHNQLECSEATSRFLVDKLNQTEALVR